MLLLHRYLLRQFLTALLFTGCAVTIVVLFTQSFRLLSLVVNNAAGLWIFLQLALLTIPTFLSIVLPIGLAVALVFVYQKLGADSELVIMRSAGLSATALAQPAIWLGGASVLLGLLLAFWVSPWANRTLVAMQYEIRNEFSVYLLRPGVFNDITKGLTFYARRRDSKGGLENLLIHDNRKPDAPVTVMADRGMVMQVDGEPRIVVFNGQRQEFDRKHNKMATLDFAQYTFDISLLRGANDRLPDPRELTLGELLSDTPMATKRGSDPARLRAELHQRLGGALTGLSYAFLMAGIMLGGQFSRRGMTGRVVIAGAAIVTLQALLMWLSNLVARDLGYLLAFYGLTLLPIPVAWLLLQHNPLAGRTTPEAA
ncbi:MAG: LptF/LptG family permease [Alphaproteobacteria bacterium]|nr:LptF/LptG family permease [Alphaproteobacteria bacterium]